MNRLHLTILSIAALASGCASTVAVRPVAITSAKIDTVCIERNAEVLVDDLLPAIEAAFQRNGIAARVCDVSPAACPYRVTYAALRRWNLTPFMSDTRISLYRERELVRHPSSTA
jgi:hypothetical protein